MIDAEAAVLSSFSLRFSSLEERLDAASRAGFRSIGMLLRGFSDAEAAGSAADQQRRMADDSGVTVAEIEALRGWAADQEAAAEHSSAEDTVWRMADTFGSRYVQVIGPFYGSLDQAADEFAALCDRAAAHGLVAGIEFLPFTNIPDAATAAAVVDRAGRANGGICVDSWHHFRGANDWGQLKALGADRIQAVQIDDGPMVPDDPDYYTDCLENRRVPGEGEFDLVSFVRLLDGMDVSVPVSLEVISRDLQQLPAVEAASLIRAGFLRVLAEARS